MDYLRNFGSAAVSSLVAKSGLNLPFSLGEKVTYFEGKSIWALHDGIKRDDGSLVSIFVYDSSQNSGKNLLPLAKNALRKLRTVRHPDIIKFHDSVETDTTVYIMTERIQPLAKAMQNLSSKGAKDKEDWLIWGLQRISTALAFINDSCKSTHGHVRVDSIFLTPSGEWKLGGFELLSNAKDESAVLYTLGSILPDANKYASPEVKKAGWSVLKEHHPAVSDAYGLGLLIHCVFNPNLPLPATAEPPHPPPASSTRGSIPTYLFPQFKKLLNPNAKARISPAAFLEIGMSTTSGEGQGFFANNSYVRICTGLDQFSILGEVDKATLLKMLKDSASSFPPEFASHRILPSLISALEFGGASASTILPLVLQLGKNVPLTDYSSIVITPITKLFTSPDRGTRMALLDHLEEYADKLENKLVADKIWPNLQTGFTDTVPVIREATVKAVGLLYTRLNDRILNNDLLRHLARMQMDPEASIRTNTCILIGRIAPSLGYNTKRKVLVPALARALKDVFVHARVAGLMALMATIDCYDIEDIATKVIVIISPALLDKEKLVRDQAFKAIELFVKKLEVHASTMPETTILEKNQPNVPMPLPGSASQNALVSTATGAAGALAGWAMSSITKKLAPADLQSVMNAATSDLDRSVSAPVPDGMPANVSGLSSPFTSPNSTVSSPGAATFASSHSRAKALQLGGSKQFPASSSKNAVLASELARELESETSHSWGGDLMDVNADADDWNAFETANPIDGTNLASATNFGFGDIRPPKTPTLIVDEDDEWGSMDAAIVSSNLRDGINSSSFTATKSSRSKSPVLIAQPRPQRPALPTSMNLSHSPPPTIAKTPPPSTIGMTKEEKAAEMARRKEERKQRIAQLKEAKKHSGVKA